MPTHDTEAARRFSIEVVRELRDAGHVAYWAGGCVRDQLLGKTPKDYDVATDATPDRIREIFGRRRTLPIGAAFGVITVLGTKAAGQIEVATFREDAEYSDGRRPDSVKFTNAEADAQRRDFTINGMFFDPLTEETIDYVGGKDDIHARLIRAIGDPAERVHEDKLRMLRAVRFASVLDFQLDEATFATIKRCAAQIPIVSPERISDELRKMLSDRHRCRAVQLLLESNLLLAVIPELQEVVAEATVNADSSWQLSLAAFPQLPAEATSSLALAMLLRPLFAREGEEAIEGIGTRLRLARDEIETIKHVLKFESAVRSAKETFWPTIQRILVMRRVEPLLDFAETLAKTQQQGEEDVEFCRRKIGTPTHEWNPPTLINGNDLQRMGLRSGPRFKELLDGVRDRQLMGELTTAEEAQDWVRSQVN